MILTPHLIIGGFIATKIEFLPLVILLAFLSHYLLDSLPHAEYSIKNIKMKEWKKSGPDFLKLLLDITVGSILIVFIYQITGKDYLTLFTAAFSAILPDILTVLKWILPNNKILRKHFDLHQKIHFSKEKKYPLFSGIFTQVFVVLLGFFLLI